MRERASIAVSLDSDEAADSERFGPKAANLAALAQAGLPTPGGTCIDAEAYRTQLAHLGLEASARRAASAELLLARRCALEVRLSLFEQPLAPPLVEPLLGAWRALCGAPAAVRSSALVEDREGASFAGQFESYLGVETEADFLTAVRACWAALWSVRALRYMASRGVDPSAADAWIGDQLARNGDWEPSRVTTASATSVAPVVEATRRSSGRRARRRRH